MTAPQIGAAGEAAVVAAFLRRGIPVYTPVGDAGIDLLADFGDRPQRIQVKTSAAETQHITYKLIRRNSGRSKALAYDWCTEYPTDMVDWFALCSLHHDTVVLIPNKGISRGITVDYAADPNENSPHTLCAAEHTLDAVLARVSADIT